MGRLGQRLVGQDGKGMIEALTRAYADEWFAHYNYYFVANTICGPASEAVIQVLRHKADRALIHANMLALRIMELGGQPVTKLTNLPDYATNKPFKLPEDVRDLDGALKAVLDAERTSIRTYHALSEESREIDPMTYQLIMELFREAVQGEEQLERLLGSPAPEMDGK